jgi:hypothetical protein
MVIQYVYTMCKDHLQTLLVIMKYGINCGQQFIIVLLKAELIPPVYILAPVVHPPPVPPSHSPSGPLVTILLPSMSVRPILCLPHRSEVTWHLSF